MEKQTESDGVPDAQKRTADHVELALGHLKRAIDELRIAEAEGQRLDAPSLELILAALREIKASAMDCTEERMKGIAIALSVIDRNSASVEVMMTASGAETMARTLLAAESGYLVRRVCEVLDRPVYDPVEEVPDGE